MDTERKSRISVIGPTVFQYTSLYIRISEAKDLPKKEMYVIINNLLSSVHWYNIITNIYIYFLEVG